MEKDCRNGTNDKCKENKMKTLFLIEFENFSKPVYVLAYDPKEAEDIIKKLYKKWEYFDPVITNIKRLAEANQYGKPSVILGNLGG